MKRILITSAIVFIVGVAMFIESCSNNPVAPSLNIALIRSSNSLEVYPMNGDTAVITGSGFGSSGSVVFTSNVSVSSANCTEWTETEIRVVIPQNAVAGGVYVTQSGKNSNIYNLDILWPHYLPADGLADSLVSSIAIDHQNNAWIGTDKGLSEFDGTHWTTYTVQNGLPSNNIHCVACDRQGNIWVGSDGGASEYNGSSWKTYTSTDGLVHNDVQAMTFDTSGNAWFGTYNGVSKFDGTNWSTYQHSDLRPDTTIIYNNVLSAAVDKKGHKWFGTYGYGVDEFYNDTVWTPYTWPGAEIPYARVYCVGVDSQGVVWIGTFTGGVSRYDGSSWTVYTKPNSGTNGLADYTVASLTFDKLGNKWFGTYNGVSKFDGTNWTTYNTNNGIPNNIITAMAFDNNGYLWIGTNGGGVAHCNFH
ncbi:MAG TPA: two-component regulator propeller domain-containing protein [Candidatus Kapabacteria bacterium]|nr:two-component regulator propeller domain-containing protein [Candidatus Kapabacteria bacterium]